MEDMEASYLSLGYETQGKGSESLGFIYTILLLEIQPVKESNTSWSKCIGTFVFQKYFLYYQRINVKKK